MARPADSSDLERLGGALRQEMSATTAGLRQEIQASATETRLHMEQSVSRILARIDASAAETRRYMGVVAEGLKSDIKAVAEGLGALDEKAERFRGEVRENFGRVDRRLLHLEVRVIGRSDPA
jgi:hypothetical protein